MRNSTYIKYVNEVCRDFLGFVELKEMDVQNIADTLLSSVEEWDLDMSSLLPVRASEQGKVIGVGVHIYMCVFVDQKEV